MFNVEEFRSYLSETGTSPKNRYVVSMGIPAALYRAQVLVNSNYRSMIDIDKDIQFRAENITLPNVSLVTSQVSRYGIGPIQRFATNAQMNDISMEFLVDRERVIWMFFYHWLNNIFSFNQIEPNDVDKSYNYYSYRTSYMSDYATTISAYIYNYDGKDENSTIVDIYDAFPVSVEQIDLGWNNNNSLMKIKVRFSYRDWRIVNTSTTDGSIKAAAPATLEIPGRKDIGATIIDSISKLFN